MCNQINKTNLSSVIWRRLKPRLPRQLNAALSFISPPPHHHCHHFIAGLLILIGLAACNNSTKEEFTQPEVGFEEFVDLYNADIQQWLVDQLDATNQKISQLEASKTNAPESELNSINNQITNLQADVDKFNYRLSHDGYFSFKSEDDIPNNLNWQDGMDQPEIGDPRAVKGGTFNYFTPTFPPTLRRTGPKTNHSFRSRIYDDIEIPLVNIHPITKQFIPGIAKRWALGPDKRTVFYEIDERATYSDDSPIVATDFMWGVYIRCSDYVVEPFFKQYLREQIANITVYSDRLLSISLPEPKPLMPFYAFVFPAPQQFYAEYGPDYTERYQWRPEPTSGAYHIKPEDLKKGISLTLSRKKDWWAKDHKFYKNAYNPDRIKYALIRNQSKAFEMFLAGELDYFLIVNTDLWYRKSEVDAAFNGYLHRYTFYNQYPRPPWGLHLNVARPLLDNLDVRIGIQHACNWQRVIDNVFQSDYSRLNNFSEGFGAFTNPDITAREYSIQKAREAFARAGFDQRGPDGILRRSDGTRLSISVTFSAVPPRSTIMEILREEAKRVGLDLRLDGLEPSVAFKKSSDKQHDSVLTAWATTPPFPRYYQFFHTDNALTPEGLPKPDTNNINSFSDPRMDAISELMRRTGDLEVLRQACFEGQQIIHDQAIFVPGYVTDFVRCGAWRWIEWPDTDTMPFCPPSIYEPLDSYLFWIDQDKEKETRKAMREGKTFPEVQKVIDHFRAWQAPTTQPLPAPLPAQSSADLPHSQPTNTSNFN